MFLFSHLPFHRVAAAGACLDGIYLTPSQEPKLALQVTSLLSTFR